jgi:hypothetical protein
MQPNTHTRSGSAKARWAGRILSALAVLFLAWDGVIKLLSLAPVAEAFARLGYPVSLAVGIGVLELACVAVYVVPRTSLLGAVLLTGYLGGAIATHVRVQDPFFTHVVFPIYVAALIWIGLLLRDARVRALTKQAFAPRLVADV